MIQTTTWRPDTCGCIISYQWDDAVPQATRTHTYHTWVPGPTCVISASVTNATTHPAIVLGAKVEGSVFTADHITKSVAIQAAAALLA
jgi:hypothetical protein